MDQLDSARFLPDLLDGLDYANFYILNLVERVAVRRCRPIMLKPWPMSGTVQYGAWLAAAQRDYIFFEAHTARVHQEHIILHELAHMLLGHPTLMVTDDIALTSEVLMRALSTLNESAREREAEALAAKLWGELMRRAGLHALTHRVATAPLWSDLAFGLGLD